MLKPSDNHFLRKKHLARTHPSGLCLLAHVHESVIGTVMGKRAVAVWAAAPADSSPFFAFTDEQIG